MKAIIKVKEYGVIEAELYRDIAPITVDNFVKLANKGFYNGLTFHRVIKGFLTPLEANSPLIVYPGPPVPFPSGQPP